MEKAEICWIGILFVFLLHSKTNFAVQHRSKRFLLYPRYTSSTVEVIVGLGVPVELEAKSVTMGYSILTQFSTPTNLSKLWSRVEDPFGVEHRSSGKRSIKNELIQNFRDNYDEQKHATEWNVLDHIGGKKVSSLASMRWTVYKALAAIADGHGFVGRSCVLRSICEFAQTSIDHSSGILGELFHIVMSPSVTSEDVINHEDNEYLYAEAMGKNGAPCDRIFNECEKSLLDIFSIVETSPLH